VSSPDNPLFRPEVVQAQTSQYLGSIRIARPLSFAVVTAVAVACAVALVSFAIWGEVSRKVSVPGVLVPEGGLMHLSSPQPVTVAEVLVKEGDVVEAGQALVRLSADRVIDDGELGQLQRSAIAQRRSALDAEARLVMLQAQQRAEALNDRLRSLQGDRVTLQAEIESALHRTALAQKNAQRFTQLAESGFVSGIQAQERQEALLEAGMRERNSRRALEAVQRDEQSLRAELAQVVTQREATALQLARQLTSLEQEESELLARTEWTISAPRTGKVSAVNAVTGGQAAAGIALVTLVAADSEEANSANLVAHLYVPSTGAGFLVPGNTVLLGYAAFPYQKFGRERGTVIRTSQTPINPQDLPSGHAQALAQLAASNEPLYRTVVAVDRQAIVVRGKEMQLKAGMFLEAKVIQEHRRVWEWIFEPILSVARRN
jgi:membrane fusion protein